MRFLLGLLLLLTSACSARPVYVVRHAEAYSNLSPVPDLPPNGLDSLTARGVEQARSLAQELVGKQIDLVLHSPTGRTTQTAQIVASLLGVPRVSTPELEPLRGAWIDREAVWAEGRDPSSKDRESMADGVQRALSVIRKYDGATLIVVTHSDIAAGLVGEAEGTPTYARYLKHKPGTGTVTPVRGLSPPK